MSLKSHNSQEQYDDDLLKDKSCFSSNIPYLP